MKTQDRSLDQDERAMADLAEVPDWSKVAGPDDDETGFKVVEALVHRVSGATGWKPWPLEPGTKINDAMESWGFVTGRGTDMIAFKSMVIADCPDSGWSAYEIGPDDIAAAEAGLDEHWPEHLELAKRLWGAPDYTGDDSNPAFTDEWAPAAGLDRRHLAVWLRSGAEFHLFSKKPARDPLSPAVGISYSVYLD